MSSKTEKNINGLTVLCMILAVFLGMFLFMPADYYHLRHTSYSGLRAQVIGNYAYLLYTYSGSGGRFDVMDAEYPLNGDVKGFRTWSSYNTPTDMHVVNGYAYISTSSQFIVIDATTVTNPIGAYSASLSPSYYYGVYVSGSNAFLANGSAGLGVVSVANPTSPAFVTSKTTTSPALDVVVSGNYAYLAVAGGGLAVIDVTTPSSPGAPVYSDTNGYATRLAVSGNYAYLADGATGLAIVNVANPLSPSTLAYRQCKANVTDIFIYGNRAYVTLSDGAGINGVAYIDISNPANPGEAVDVLSLTAAKSVFVDQKLYKYIYVGEIGEGMYFGELKDEVTLLTVGFIIAVAAFAFFTIGGYFFKKSLRLKQSKLIQIQQKQNAEAQQRLAEEAKIRAEQEAQLKAIEDAKRRSEEETRRHAEEEARMKKLQQIIKVSNKLAVERIAQVLELPVEETWKRVFDWAEKFQFTIDGDYIIFNKDTVNDFIASMDKEFASWGGEGKV